MALSLPSAVAGNHHPGNLLSPSGLLGNSETLVSTTGNVSLKFSGFLTGSTDVASNGAWSPTKTAQATKLYAKTSGGDEKRFRKSRPIRAESMRSSETSFIQVDLAGLAGTEDDYPHSNF